MARDRAKNSLRAAFQVELNNTTQRFKDTLNPTDLDDLYCFKLSDRSSFTLDLSKIKKGANADVEVFELKDTLTKIPGRIGKIDFSDLKGRDIRKVLTRLGRSRRKNNQSEALDLILDPGTYYVRVYWRSGTSKYTLNLAANSLPTDGGSSPSPTPPPPPPEPGPGTPPSSTSWIRQLGTAQNDLAFGIALQPSTNEVIAAGATSGVLSGTALGAVGEFDNYVTKYDTNGTLLTGYPRQFDTSDTGSSQNDAVFDIVVDSIGNYYVAGATNAAISGQNQGADGFVAKYDSNGNRLWLQLIQSTVNVNVFGTSIPAPAGDVALSLTLDQAGNVYVSGITEAIPKTSVSLPVIGSVEVENPSNAFIAKYNGSTGTQVWKKTYGGSAWDGASSIAVDNNGDVYLGGIASGDGLSINLAGFDFEFESGDGLLARFNGTTGDLIWDETLTSAGKDYIYGIAVSGSNLYVTGDTTGTLPGGGQANAGEEDGFVASYSTSGGSPLWVKQFGTTAQDRSVAIALDTQGNLYLTGTTKGSLFGNTVLGGADAWVAKFDPTGNRVADTQFGTPQDETGYKITLDSIGNIYLVGQTAGGLSTPNAGQVDAWIAKLLPSSLS